MIQIFIADGREGTGRDEPTEGSTRGPRGRKNLSATENKIALESFQWTTGTMSAIWDAWRAVRSVLHKMGGERHRWKPILLLTIRPQLQVVSMWKFYEMRNPILYRQQDKHTNWRALSQLLQRSKTTKWGEQKVNKNQTWFTKHPIDNQFDSRMWTQVNPN